MLRLLVSEYKMEHKTSGTQMEQPHTTIKDPCFSFSGREPKLSHKMSCPPSIVSRVDFSTATDEENDYYWRLLYLREFCTCTYPPPVPHDAANPLHEVSEAGPYGPNVFRCPSSEATDASESITFSSEFADTKMQTLGERNVFADLPSSLAESTISRGNSFAIDNRIKYASGGQDFVVPPADTIALSRRGSLRKIELAKCQFGTIPAVSASITPPQRSLSVASFSRAATRQFLNGDTNRGDTFPANPYQSSPMQLTGAHGHQHLAVAWWIASVAALRSAGWPLLIDNTMMAMRGDPLFAADAQVDPENEQRSGNGFVRALLNLFDERTTAIKEARATAFDNAFVEKRNNEILNEENLRRIRRGKAPLRRLPASMVFTADHLQMARDTAIRLGIIQPLRQTAEELAQANFATATQRGQGAFLCTQSTLGSRETSPPTLSSLPRRINYIRTGSTILSATFPTHPTVVSHLESPPLDPLRPRKVPHSSEVKCDGTGMLHENPFAHSVAPPQLPLDIEVDAIELYRRKMRNRGNAAMRRHVGDEKPPVDLESVSGDSTSICSPLKRSKNVVSHCGTIAHLDEMSYFSQPASGLASNRVESLTVPSITGDQVLSKCLLRGSPHLYEENRNNAPSAVKKTHEATKATKEFDVKAEGVGRRTWEGMHSHSLQMANRVALEHQHMLPFMLSIADPNVIQSFSKRMFEGRGANHGDATGSLPIFSASSTWKEGVIRRRQWPLSSFLFFLVRDIAYTDAHLIALLRLLQTRVREHVHCARVYTVDEAQRHEGLSPRLPGTTKHMCASITASRSGAGLSVLDDNAVGLAAGCLAELSGATSGKTLSLAPSNSIQLSPECPLILLEKTIYDIGVVLEGSAPPESHGETISAGLRAIRTISRDRRSRSVTAFLRLLNFFTQEVIMPPIVTLQNDFNAQSSFYPPPPCNLSEAEFNDVFNLGAWMSVRSRNLKIRDVSYPFEETMTTAFVFAQTVESRLWSLKQRYQQLEMASPSLSTPGRDTSFKSRPAPNVTIPSVAPIPTLRSTLFAMPLMILTQYARPYLAMWLRPLVRALADLFGSAHVGSAWSASLEEYKKKCIVEADLEIETAIGGGFDMALAHRPSPPSTPFSTGSGRNSRINSSDRGGSIAKSPRAQKRNAMPFPDQQGPSWIERWRIGAVRLRAAVRSPASTSEDGLSVAEEALLAKFRRRRRGMEIQMGDANQNLTKVEAEKARVEIREKLEQQCFEAQRFSLFYTDSQLRSDAADMITLVENEQCEKANRKFSVGGSSTENDWRGVRDVLGERESHIAECIGGSFRLFSDIMGEPDDLFANSSSSSSLIATFPAPLRAMLASFCASIYAHLLSSLVPHTALSECVGAVAREKERRLRAEASKVGGVASLVEDPDLRLDEELLVNALVEMIDARSSHANEHSAPLSSLKEKASGKKMFEPIFQTLESKSTQSPIIMDIKACRLARMILFDALIIPMLSDPVAAGIAVPEADSVSQTAVDHGRRGRATSGKLREGPMLGHSSKSSASGKECGEHEIAVDEHVRRSFHAFSKYLQVVVHAPLSSRRGGLLAQDVSSRAGRKRQTGMVDGDDDPNESSEGEVVDSGEDVANESGAAFTADVAACFKGLPRLSNVPTYISGILNISSGRFVHRTPFCPSFFVKRNQQMLMKEAERIRDLGGQPSPHLYQSSTNRGPSAIPNSELSGARLARARTQTQPPRPPTAGLPSPRNEGSPRKHELRNVSATDSEFSESFENLCGSQANFESVCVARVVRYLSEKKMPSSYRASRNDTRLAEERRVAGSQASEINRLDTDKGSSFEVSPTDIIHLSLLDGSLPSVTLVVHKSFTQQKVARDMPFPIAVSRELRKLNEDLGLLAPWQMNYPDDQACDVFHESRHSGSSSKKRNSEEQRSYLPLYSKAAMLNESYLKHVVSSVYTLSTKAQEKTRFGGNQTFAVSSEMGLCESNGTVFQELGVNMREALSSPAARISQFLLTACRLSDFSVRETPAVPRAPQTVPQVTASTTRLDCIEKGIYVYDEVKKWEKYRQATKFDEKAPHGNIQKIEARVEQAASRWRRTLPPFDRGGGATDVTNHCQYGMSVRKTSRRRDTDNLGFSYDARACRSTLPTATEMVKSSATSLFFVLLSRHSCMRTDGDDESDGAGVSLTSSTSPYLSHLREVLASTFFVERVKVNILANNSVLYSLLIPAGLVGEKCLEKESPHGSSAGSFEELVRSLPPLPNIESLLSSLTSHTAVDAVGSYALRVASSSFPNVVDVKAQLMGVRSARVKMHPQASVSEAGTKLFSPAAVFNRWWSHMVVALCGRVCLVVAESNPESCGQWRSAMRDYLAALSTSEKRRTQSVSSKKGILAKVPQPFSPTESGLFITPQSQQTQTQALDLGCAPDLAMAGHVLGSTVSSVLNHKAVLEAGRREAARRGGGAAPKEREAIALRGLEALNDVSRELAMAEKHDQCTCLSGDGRM